MAPTLFSVEHRTVSAVSGPLLIADHVDGVGYNESVEVICPSGEVRRGQVLEVDGNRVVLQVLGGTRGLDVDITAVRARGELTTIGVGRDLVGPLVNLFVGPTPQ